MTEAQNEAKAEKSDLFLVTLNDCTAFNCADDVALLGLCWYHLIELLRVVFITKVDKDIL